MKIKFFNIKKNQSTMSNSNINIGPQQQATRRYVGIATVIVTVILSGFAIINDWDLLLTGVLLFLLYLTGVLSLLEDKYEVCAVNAMRNMESMTGRLSFGQEKMPKESSGIVRRIAFKEIWQSVLISGVATAVVLVLIGII